MVNMFKYILIIVSTFTLGVKLENNLINSSNRLAFDLLNILPKNENIFFSPLSITTVLLMLLNGANGITEKELKNILNIEQNCNYI